MLFFIARLRSFLVALRSAYHSRNAYHNFAHAVDVTQACYSFLVRLGLSPPLETLLDEPGAFEWMRNPAGDEEGCLGSIIRPMDVFALLIAAIGHDVGHPGLSNAYMVSNEAFDGATMADVHMYRLMLALRLHRYTTTSLSSRTSIVLRWLGCLSCMVSAGSLMPSKASLVST